MVVDDTLAEKVLELRGIGVSVTDICRQTGVSRFDVHEIIGGREAAVKKTARVHFMRGTGWPWDREDNHPDRPKEPTGNPEEDAAQGIVNLFRGATLDDPMREYLDALPMEERRRMLDVIGEIIRMSSVRPTRSDED